MNFDTRELLYIGIFCAAGYAILGPLGLLLAACICILKK